MVWKWLIVAVIIITNILNMLSFYLIWSSQLLLSPFYRWVYWGWERLSVFSRSILDYLVSEWEFELLFQVQVQHTIRYTTYLPGLSSTLAYLELSLLHQSAKLVNWQVFIEYLIHARHCTRHQEYKYKERKPSPSLLAAGPNQEGVRHHWRQGNVMKMAAFKSCEFEFQL